MKNLSLKTIKSVISFVLVSAMLITNMTFVLPIKSYAVNSSDDIGSTQHEINPQNRDINTLKKSPNVLLSEDGKQILAATQDKKDEFTQQEIESMFGNTLKAGENTQDVKNQKDYSEIESKYEFSKNDIDTAKALHNSMESFSFELTSFDCSASFTKLSPDARRSILSLIKNGYTNSQAYAAYVASDILGISIDELAKSKADEIGSKLLKIDEPYIILVKYCSVA